MRPMFRSVLTSISMPMRRRLYGLVLQSETAGLAGMVGFYNYLRKVPHSRLRPVVDEENPATGAGATGRDRQFLNRKGPRRRLTVMRDPANRRQTLSDLHFALDVMEERSHIGLDDKTAATVRQALLHRIAEAEKALGQPSSVPLDIQRAKELLRA
jgi:hypothetical protein